MRMFCQVVGTHLESIDTLLMISSHAFLQGAKNCRGAIVIFFEGGLPARSTLKLAKKKPTPQSRSN